MKIDIGDYLITSDSMCWTLNEKKVSNGKKNKGKEYLNPVGYYTNASHLVEALVRREIRLADATTFAEAEKAAQGVAQSLCKRLDPYFEVTVR